MPFFFFFFFNETTSLKLVLENVIHPTVNLMSMLHWLACQVEVKYSGLVRTETAQNWNKSFTQVNVSHGSIGQSGFGAE